MPITTPTTLPFPQPVDIHAEAPNEHFKLYDKVTGLFGAVFTSVGVGSGTEMVKQKIVVLISVAILDKNERRTVKRSKGMNKRI